MANQSEVVRYKIVPFLMTLMTRNPHCLNGSGIYQKWDKADIVTIKYWQVYQRRYERHRSPNCIRETKSTFCGTPVSILLPKFCGKLFLHTKFHWNWTISCWVMAKNEFKMAAVRQLEFKKIIFCYICVLNFVKNGMIFRLDMAISRFSRWRISAILNFMGQ